MKERWVSQRGHTDLGGGITRESTAIGRRGPKLRRRLRWFALGPPIRPCGPVGSSKPISHGARLVASTIHASRATTDGRGNRQGWFAQRDNLTQKALLLSPSLSPFSHHQYLRPGSLLPSLCANLRLRSLSPQ